MDLIDRKATIDALETDWNGMVVDVFDFIRNLPSVETEPVRHGRWETDGMPMDDGEYLMTRCTVCGTAYEYGHNENYCGYCGAKMDEET